MSETKLNHPCKNTCSGWSHGFENGKEYVQFEVDCLTIEMNGKVEDLNQQVNDLKMVCRRLSSAKTLESRDRIAKQCHNLFKGSALREPDVNYVSLDIKSEGGTNGPICGD